MWQIKVSAKLKYLDNESTWKLKVPGNGSTWKLKVPGQWNYFDKVFLQIYL